MHSGAHYAVLTGDIISSSRFKSEPGQHLVDLIQEGERKIRAGLPGVLYAGVDVFRGDSWQLVLNQPISCLRVTLLFRASLQASAGIDSRVGIGIGPVDYLPEQNISSGTGTAFTLSGQGLERLEKPVRMIMDLDQDLQDLDRRALNTVLSLIDLQVQRWTRKQAEAVSGALLGRTQQQIAQQWSVEPISQQAISQHLESAGWSQIKDSLEFVENTLRMIYKA